MRPGGVGSALFLGVKPELGERTVRNQIRSREPIEGMHRPPNISQSGEWDTGTYPHLSNRVPNPLGREGTSDPDSSA